MKKTRDLHKIPFGEGFLTTQKSMMKCTNSQTLVNSSFIYLRVHKVGCSILSDIQTSLGGNNLAT